MPSTHPSLRQLEENLFCFTDTCNVYILRQGDAALLIDFGDGGVLDVLPSIGVHRVEWVLFTHHHREQCQNIQRLRESGAQVAVPLDERDFFETPLRFRKTQPQLEDAFSIYGASYLRPPREAIQVDRTFAKYDDFQWRDSEFWTLGTPGNSPGSMTYLLRRDDGWLAFSGDLMLDDARMHTWFDSEWDYGYASGLYALYSSAFALERFAPRRLFPSHGPIVENPQQQLPLYRQKLKALTKLYLRGWEMNYHVEAADIISQPSLVPHLWQIAPHLYKFTGAGFGSNFHMILADSGHALFIDCGCWDTEWLDRRLVQMQQRLGLQKIDAVIITHMHGDHILEAPHIRDKWGAELWTLDMVAEKFEHPERFDYPALITAYGDAVPVKFDRTFGRGEVLRWEGFELTFDWLPGQTEFALVLHGRIDGHLVAFTGDNIFSSPNESGHDALVARNSALLEEGYLYCAEYLSRLQPDLILGGHSVVIAQPAAQIERLRRWAYEVREALRALSPDESYEYGFDPFWVRAYPYRLRVAAGGCAAFTLIVRNHRDRVESHCIEIKLPEGWTATPAILEGEIEAREKQEYEIFLTVSTATEPAMQLITFDTSLDGRRYGEWFDMIVEVTEASQ
jgi:glyoxylase-like metal-dependent hydrolase (beta-lactamase superfamily II)